jgi:hypothetical protein
MTSNTDCPSRWCIVICGRVVCRTDHFGEFFTRSSEGTVVVVAGEKRWQPTPQHGVGVCLDKLPDPSRGLLRTPRMEAQRIAQ